MPEPLFLSAGGYDRVREALTEELDRVHQLQPAVLQFVLNCRARGKQPGKYPEIIDTLAILNIQLPVAIAAIQQVSETMNRIESLAPKQVDTDVAVRDKQQKGDDDGHIRDGDTGNRRRNRSRADGKSRRTRGAVGVVRGGKPAKEVQSRARAVKR